MNPLRIALLASAASSAALLGQTTGQATGQTPDPKPPAPAATNWLDLTRSGLPIKFYGFLRLDAYYNTSRFDSVVIPTRVLPETKRNDDQVHMDPRLTRFGFDITPAEINGAKVLAKLETDFANFPTGSSESRATPRIRLAYIDVAKNDLGLRVGQDWDIISPLFPAVNGEMLMWNAGNLGDRRAQIQGRYAPKGGAFDVKAALGLTGAVNNQDLDTTTGERDGFDSGLPHLQMRAGYTHTREVEWTDRKDGKESPAKSKVTTQIGAWGMFGRTETDTAFGGEHRFDTWTMGLDWSIGLTRTLTLRGEAWRGENLGDVRGGVGQTINTTTGKEIGSTGGWAELVCSCTAKTKFHVGGTIDDPDNDDLGTTSSFIRRNLAGYLGTTVDWETGIRTGFDVTWWQTEYAGADGTNGSSGNAMRFDLYFQYNF